MEVRDLDARRSVLIVNQSSEAREVLRTVLEQRGLRIFEASAADEGLAIVQSQRPDLVVVDVEIDSASPAEISDEFASRTRPRQTPLVLLGTARRATGRLPCEFVAKPYHYAPLVRRIEQLLDGVQ
jgi:CheY-like chemotaxis protein